MHGKVVALISTSLVGLTACVFFVPGPSDDVGATCRLKGDEGRSTCGICLAASCQGALDACCAEGSSCEPSIASLTLCDSDDSKCAARGGSPAEEALRACASASCGIACEDGIKGQVDAGPPALVRCESSLDECSCQATADGGSTSAPSSCRTSSGITGMRCCAESGYPTTEGKRCACRQVYCLESSGTCRCGYFVRSSGDAKSSCGGSLRLCCRDMTGTSCECRAGLDACPSGSVETDTCSVTSIACLLDEDKMNTNLVSTCSP
jgi:hypothetical protein